MISTYEFELGGKTRGFRFGTYSTRLIEEQTGVSDLQTIMDRLKEQNIKMLSAFFFSCARHYSHSVSKQPVDYDEVDVNDWLDELGPAKAADAMLALFHQYLPKNSEPPQETGEEVKSAA